MVTHIFCMVPIQNPFFLYGAPYIFRFFCMVPHTFFIFFVWCTIQFLIFLYGAPYKKKKNFFITHGAFSWTPKVGAINTLTVAHEFLRYPLNRIFSFFLRKPTFSHFRP